jgi:hypothetical protein
MNFHILYFILILNGPFWYVKSKFPHMYFVFLYVLKFRLIVLC